MYRRIAFTLNNYTEAEYALCCSILEKQQYAIVAREVGEGGTPHLQGYCELASQKRLSTLKNQWGDRYHFERAIADQESNIKYCSKDGNFIEFGQRRVAGERTDLDRTRREASDGGMRSVVRWANSQQIRVAEKYLSYCEEPRATKPKVYWLWGPTGSGKSKKALELVGDDVFWKSDSSSWFDGYDGHEYAVLDDFRDTWMSFSDFLTLLDRYERRVPFKGGFRQWKPNVIVITSSFSPKDVYLDIRENKKQLLRRIDECIHVSPFVDDEVL